MLDKLNQGIFIIDSNNRIILINNKTEELLNLPKESITQLTWKEWLEKWQLDDLAGLTSRKHRLINWNQKWLILQKCPSSKDELIFTLQETEQILDLERILRRKLNGDTLLPEGKVTLKQVMKKLRVARGI